ncbi:MAG: hypothetical protein NZZ41_07180, partial [Candidatus Dojkabacteria bacterium]|nr:hypothetical protein [Candidatus Dojkabacteria bacterium]
MRIRLIRKTDFEHELYYSIRLNNAFLEKKGVIVSKKEDTEDIDVSEKESKIEKTVKKEKSNKKKSLNLDVFYCEVKGIYDLYEEELKGYLVDTFLDTGKITGFKPFDYDNAIKRKKFILDFDRVNNLNNILAQMFDIKKEQIKDRRDRTFIERMTEKVIKGVARRPFADRAKVVSSYYHLKIANSIPLLVSLVFSDLLSDKKINNFKLGKKQEKNFFDLEKRVQVYFEEEVVDFFDVDIKEAKYYEFDYSDNSSIIKKLKKY